MSANFKPSNQNQLVLFPQPIDKYIDKNHPARLINKIVDKMDISDILATYSNMGASSYHPRMMLKILFYAYLINMYSARKIANALQENIVFMWLAGGQTPDFRTINNFRSKRLKNNIDTLFMAVVETLVLEGVLDIREVYIDGTKIEANANRYSFVWAKSLIKYKSNLAQKIRVILSEIEAQINEDNSYILNEPDSIEELDSSSVAKRIEQAYEALSSKELDEKKQKEIKKKLSKLEKEALPRLERYQEQLSIVGQRNSYSKTDPDATFMRMKEDHMRNGQLKPGYNIQIATNNEFIVDFGIFQNRSDSPTLVPFLEQYKSHYGFYPSVVVADAGYGSEVNYSFLFRHQIKAFVKYNWFDKEQKKKYKQSISRKENLYYNAVEDYFVCAMGQHMYPIGQRQRVDKQGNKYEVTVYQAQRCQGCPLASLCHKSRKNRSIEINHRLRKYRLQAKELLESQEGKYRLRRRMAEVEGVFAQIKHNKAFRRFSLRGLDKVKIEFALVAIAYNLQKLWKILFNKRGSGNNTPPDKKKYRENLSFFVFFLFLLQRQKKNSKILEKFS